MVDALVTADWTDVVVVVAEVPDRLGTSEVGKGAADDSCVTSGIEDVV